MGKWVTPSDQKWAPPHTHFHQFVIPPIIESRLDCTYGKLAGVQLPKDIKGVRSCEVPIFSILPLYLTKKCLCQKICSLYKIVANNLFESHTLSNTNAL